MNDSTDGVAGPAWKGRGISCNSHRMANNLGEGQSVSLLAGLPCKSNDNFVECVPRKQSEPGIEIDGVSHNPLYDTKLPNFRSVKNDDTNLLIRSLMRQPKKKRVPKRPHGVKKSKGRKKRKSPKH